MASAAAATMGGAWVNRPLVVIYPDGNEIDAIPRSGGFALLKRLLVRRPKPKLGHHTVSVPADYKVELRERTRAA